jgi:phosphate butyryltransferase
MKFKNFEELLSTVKGRTNRVVVPGANNAEALEAIKMADDNGLISSGILIGDTALVSAMARERGLNLSRFELVQCADPVQMCMMAVDFIVKGKGDFLVKGLVDTKYYMKAILQKEAGLVPAGALLSHFVLFDTPRYKKIFAMTDAAVLINPTQDQKMCVIQNSVDVMRRLGVEHPKVSMVCPVEKVNEKIQSTVDAAEMVKRAKEGRIRNATVEGPYDVYITFSRILADEKGIKGGEVPGDADIAVFPNLDAANTVYKSISFFGDHVSGATILVGAKIPVILPSRADAPSTKLNSIALASFLKDQK